MRLKSNELTNMILDETESLNIKNSQHQETMNLLKNLEGAKHYDSTDFTNNEKITVMLSTIKDTAKEECTRNETIKIIKLVMRLRRTDEQVHILNYVLSNIYSKRETVDKLNRKILLTVSAA
jgi:hypothetical protein